ncbi:site-specific DNA-methyltransferase [Hydrogenimonas sp.]
MIEKLQQHTLDLTDDHIAKIAEMFPHCVVEVEDENGMLTKAIDFDLLRQELAKNIVDGPKERYRLEWPGKRASLVSANTPITKTLRPAREESVDFDTTRNLYIEGDNLDALKLLQKSYLGAVKMIYIDPPYNTGKDFVYKDNFTRSREEELTQSGQIDEEGGRLVSNPQSNGRFHSDWLNMMYPRLRLARNLLRDDGVIFISIDDNEVHNLRKMCDEVLGEENFEAQICWRRRHNQPNDKSKMIAKVSEYIITYSKNSPYLKKEKTYYGVPLSQSRIDEYTNPDNDPKGPWTTNPWKAAVGRGGSQYIITTPTGIEYNEIWYGNKETFLKYIEEGRVHWTDNGNGYPRIKRYLSEALKEGQPAIDFFKHEVFGSNSEASSELREILETDGVFDNPKPVKLISSLLKIATSDDDLILDFFSGSATTAHAVMQLNAEDGGNRKFIMVQLPEPTDEKSEAYKAGYKTIAEIGKERIRRAGRKIKEESADKEGIENLDIGFRVLKVDSSNMKDVYFTPDEASRENLLDTVDHIKPDRTAEDLLFGVLVDWGVDLTLPIRRESIEGKTVYFVGEDALAACFEENLDETFLKALAEREVLRVVFKESGFANDAAKINAEQIFAQLAPGTDVRVI